MFKYLFPVIAGLLLLVSCSETEIEEPANLIKKSELQTIGGKCKVSFKGKTENGTTIDDTFELEATSDRNFYSVDTNNKYHFIGNHEQVDPIIFNNYFSYSIYYDEVSSEASISSMYLNYSKKIDEHTIYEFLGFSYGYDSKLSDFSFDKSSSTISGTIITSTIQYDGEPSNTMEIKIVFESPVKKQL